MKLNIMRINEELHKDKEVTLLVSSINSDMAVILNAYARGVTNPPPEVREYLGTIKDFNNPDYIEFASIYLSTLLRLPKLQFENDGTRVRYFIN